MFLARRICEWVITGVLALLFVLGVRWAVAKAYAQ